MNAYKEEKTRREKIKLSLIPIREFPAVFT